MSRDSLNIVGSSQRVAVVETIALEEPSPSANPAPQQRIKISDHLSSEVIDLSDTGQLVSFEEFHPQGTSSFQAGRTTIEVGAKRNRYTSKERDEETGLTYHGARYHAPWLARWTSSDPLGIVDSMSLYVYANNEPINHVDDDGRKVDPPKKKKDEDKNRFRALKYAWGVSYAMTAQFRTQRAWRGLEKWAKGDNYKDYPVESPLSGAFLRMYLEHKVDSSVMSQVSEELQQEPAFKELQSNIQSRISKMGMIVTKEGGDKLVMKRTSVYLNYKKSKDGIKFRYEMNPIIGGVSGVEVVGANITQTDLGDKIRVGYQVDVKFRDTYDFSNERSGVYEKFRKELSGYLDKGDYQKFWAAYGKEEKPWSRKLKLTNAQVFASFMYAIEKQKWTPGPLAWDVTVPFKGSFDIAKPTTKKRTRQ